LFLVHLKPLALLDGPVLKMVDGQQDICLHIQIWVTVNQQQCLILKQSRKNWQFSQAKKQGLFF